MYKCKTIKQGEKVDWMELLHRSLLGLGGITLRVIFYVILFFYSFQAHKVHIVPAQRACSVFFFHFVLFFAFIFGSF